MTLCSVLMATAPGPDGGVGSQLEITRANISIDDSESTKHNTNAQLRRSRGLSGVVETLLPELDAVFG